MLVYLKLYLFNACNQNRHNECQGADMHYDVNGDVQVKVCDCKCHETEPIPVRNQPVEVKR